MSTPTLDANWQMTRLFLAALAVLGISMKIIAFFAPASSQKTSWALIFSPALSPESFKRSAPLGGITHYLGRIVFFGGAVLLCYWVYWQLVRRFELRGIALSYLAMPVLLLISEVLVAIATLCWLPSGRVLPALHNDPLFARGVADFWRRWNLWFNEWFRYTIFARLRRRPVLALFVIFGISGLMHEWVINLPLYLVTGRMLFGSMMLYFLLQAAGVLLERHFVKRNTWVKIFFGWLVVLGPAPLILNEGLLRTLHLWPD